MPTIAFAPRSYGWKMTGLLALFALGGCASVAPSVPADIAQNSTAFQVRSASQIYRLRGAYFEVADYKVARIEHSIVQGNALSIGRYSQTFAAGDYDFLLMGPRASWPVQCHRQAMSRSVRLERVDAGIEKSGLRCELGSGAQRADLVLDDTDGRVHGTVRIGESTYDIGQYFQEAAQANGWYLPGPRGLRIDQGGKNVAALTLAYPGTFWFNPAVAPQQQDALAGVLAALLINARRY